MKKYILTLILCISMLFIFNFTIPASAKTNEPSTLAAATTEDNWDYILNNVEISYKYLDKPDYVGLLYDSYALGKSSDGYVYLVYTTPYNVKNNVTLLELTESGKTYRLYQNIEDMNNNNGIWLSTVSKDFPEYDISIKMTPISGIKDNMSFGIPLKRNYNFSNFKFGYEKTNVVLGSCNRAMKFDLGLTPKLDGKNSLVMCSLKYAIIDRVEIQSFLDVPGHLGWAHYAYFNTTIKPKCVYRVDVSYKVTNDEKKWYEFYLKSDEKLIKKSLTTERIDAGFMGLYSYQGFSEGSYQSTINSSYNYKYKLHLNYNSTSWNWFSGQEFSEASYKRVSEFQILRLNFVVDEDTYDVPVACDVLEGSTLNILDDNLILDTSTNYYKVKDTIDDFINNMKTAIDNVKNNFDQYKTAFIIIGCCLGGIVLMIPLLKFIFYMKSLLGNKGKDQTG